MPEFHSYEEALQAVGNRMVELQGMIEAHRYVLTTLLHRLDSRAVLPAKETSGLMRAMIEIVQDTLDARPADRTAQLQHGAAIGELNDLLRAFEGPQPPQLTVVQGGKRPD